MDLPSKTTCKFCGEEADGILLDDGTYHYPDQCLGCLERIKASTQAFGNLRKAYLDLREHAEALDLAEELPLGELAIAITNLGWEWDAVIEKRSDK